MTKYEWTKQHIDVIAKEYPPDDRRYMDAFLSEVQKAGQALTRTRFFELFEACGPTDNDEAGYFDYEVLSDRWALVANFGEAWELPAVDPLPRIVTTAKFGDLALPEGFCTLGGEPDWIQNEQYPICPNCDVDMVLVLQLRSLPYQVTEKHRELKAFEFGDAGNFYLFTCPRCGAHKTSSDCH